MGEESGHHEDAEDLRSSTPLPRQEVWMHERERLESQSPSGWAAKEENEEYQQLSAYVEETLRRTGSCGIEET